MPAQVPIEDRNSANGDGALPSPPPAGDWSVSTTKSPKCAFTFFPPGKRMLIIYIYPLLVFFHRIPLFQGRFKRNGTVCEKRFNFLGTGRPRIRARTGRPCAAPPPGRPA